MYVKPTEMSVYLYLADVFIMLFTWKRMHFPILNEYGFVTVDISFLKLFHNIVAIAVTTRWDYIYIVYISMENGTRITYSHYVIIFCTMYVLLTVSCLCCCNIMLPSSQLTFAYTSITQETKIPINMQFWKRMEWHASCSHTSYRDDDSNQIESYKS